MYAILRGSLARPVILLVHGLTGFNNEHIFYNGARFFDHHGISSLRINLYEDERGARCLTDCTLKTHASDVTDALHYLRMHGVKQVFAAGHSYGGPSIMLADQSLLDGLILWDGSYRAPFFRTIKKNPISKNKFLGKWGMEFAVGKKMIDFNQTLNWNRMAASIKKPLLVICAGKGILERGGREYTKRAQGPAKRVIIPGADHCFNQEGTEEKLFHETLKWIKAQK